jgi:hypothetical protein
MSKMISLTEDGMILTSEPVAPGDFVNALLMAQLNFFRDVVARTRGKEKEEMTNYLYDMYNSAASAFLKAFAPEIELRPDLTEQAILEKENEILEREAAKIKPTGAFEQTMKDLSDRIKSEMEKDGLIPLDSLDEHGKPKVTPFKR